MTRLRTKIELTIPKTGSKIPNKIIEISTKESWPANNDCIEEEATGLIEKAIIIEKNNAIDANAFHFSLIKIDDMTKIELSVINTPVTESCSTITPSLKSRAILVN